MPIKIDYQLAPRSLLPRIQSLFDLSAQKLLSLQRTWKPAQGSPVLTVAGRYTGRGWTEWTQGFQFGSLLLQFDATGEKRFLESGRKATAAFMATHVSHLGVHDHGFNNVSTYGHLLRLSRQGRIHSSPSERAFYELALKVSGAVQAGRWSRLADGTGFIYSFNGPHSLFVDTIRSCRVLALAHQLGHVLMGEQEERIGLLERLAEHAFNTARYNIYYGEGRDAYDVRGRTAHEAVFNPSNGVFRCPNSHQGYSPFSTWTRGLAWAICGFAEELEFFAQAVKAKRPKAGQATKPRPLDLRATEAAMLKAALATSDFYLEMACADGVPMWDTGAPNLHRLPADYLEQPADPYNAWEPVDSSAAAIAAQGLIRLGRYLSAKGQTGKARRYRQAGLTTARTLFEAPYLCQSPKHQGLLLHSVYHRPNGWDYVAPGQRVPNGESSMWGDYHLRELALLLLREASGGPYPVFFLQ